MKTFSTLAITLLLCFASRAATQPAPDPSADPAVPPPTAYQIVNRDANSRVWQRDTYLKLPDGHIATQHHSYTECAAGLHYQDAQGNWLDSQEIIEAFSGGAIARQGPTQIIFANNLNSAGAIDVQEQDGTRLISNILGLAYYDSATGNSVLIAQIQDSTGELIATNQVLFPNALSGAQADIRYTYKKSSLEQDVILREQLPTPESFGLSSETTELEVMTEFLNPPQETIREQPGTDGADTDQNISWGTTRLGHGKAFELGAENDFRAKVAVKRHYTTINGRKILLEIVPLDNISASLQKLPQHAAIKSKSKLKTASKKLLLPRTPLARTTTGPMRMATAATSGQGYVLDYVQINTDQGSYTFRADSTYYLSEFNYYDNITFEGGTVIKYAIGADIDNWGTVTCKTGPYCPALLTAKDDDSCGEQISGSTGAPNDYYAYYAIGQESAGGSYQYLRIAYAVYGLNLTSSNHVSDCQFLHDASAIACYSTPGLQIDNSLFWNVGTALDNWSGTFPVGAVNLTVHNTSNLTASGITLSLTNSLLICVTNLGAAFTSVNCATNASDAGVFQVAGAGSHYLPTNSPYCNLGTTNISAALLADLATKTTYAPLIYSNTAIAGGTYPPAVQRDTDIPDLGYHYDPLDYCFGRVNVSTNMVFPAGTAVAYFDLPASGGAPYNSYGVGLPNASSITYLGTLASPCAQVFYSTAQEGNGNWTAVPGWSDVAVVGFVAGLGTAAHNPSIAATSNARFTLFAGHASQSAVGGADTSNIIFRFTDCVVNSGRADSWDASLWYTNCLLLGTAFGAYTYDSSSAAVFMQNCTMREGALYSGHYGGTTWPMKFQNSAFESVDFSHTADDGESTVTSVTYSDYNAFVTNQTRLPLHGTHDQIVTNFNWQTSWLGNYYLPPDSPLIDAGSAPADQLGFYQFTTQTNQAKEGVSYMDIGYHFVAIDPTTGQPYATYTNGVPDYLEDASGNGLPDWWDWHWFGTYAYSSTNLDGSGSATLLDDYNNGLDPNVIYFSIQATNDYVNHTNVSIQLSISGGIPSYYAVFVDSTATTNWLAFSTTNLTVNLGSTDGTYDVVVGLKGFATNATETWQNYAFILDQTPFLVTVTNPVLVSQTATVAKPYLQLQGFANGAVYSLSYDLSNAAGVFTKQDVFVSDQVFDVSTFAFTTNYFQAYDVPLATNANNITLHAADRAGNITTTNFTVILDYSSTTNPSVLTLLWPQDGMRVSGTNCAIRGTFSDETGTLVAQVVTGLGTTNIVTNTVNGLIERNNMFWLENVPLNGTNQITIQATNAAGIMTTTNFTILPASFNLVVGLGPIWDSYRGNVIGYVADANATIWVNGVQGTNYHDGTWSADGVPVYGCGTATFDVSASSGAGTAAISTELEMPPKIIVTGYALAESNVDSLLFLPGASISTDINVNYHAGFSPVPVGGSQYRFAGNAGRYYDLIGTNDNITGTWSESATNAIETFIDPATGTHVYPYDFAVHSNLTTLPHMDPPVTHFYARGQRFQFDFSENNPAEHQRLTLSLDAQTVETLYTGGKSPVLRQTLFSLGHDTVQSYQPVPAGALSWVLFPWQTVLFQTNVLDNSRVQLGALVQPPAADGNIWKNLPGNSSGIDVTPHVPGAKNFGTRPTLGFYQLHMTANGNDLFNATASFCVGQKITFGVTGFPAGIDPAQTTYQWYFPGTYVNDSTSPIPGSSSTNYFINSAQLSNAAPYAWWASGGSPASYHVTVKCSFFLTNGGGQLWGGGDGYISMFEPDVNWNGTIISPILADSNYIGNGLFPGVTSWLHFGGYQTNGTNVYGIIFKTNNINTYGFTGYNIFPLQVVAPSQLVNCQTNGESRHQTNDFGLDNILHYDSSLKAFFDFPGSGCLSGDQQISINFSYQAFLMFNPDKTGTSDSINVPLRLIAWQWQATATNGTSNNWGLSTTPSAAITSDNHDATGNFPMWRTNLQVSWPSGYGRYTNNDCSL
ncbi:MAG TPA: hypothetical protein VK815_14305 [Candidatus Acidoferrales bacterium]|jgi:hypothetical protein|nr:hypothetical protein [Candidatus Acidoferrales bacterium]